jgi:hypothetical protein
MADNLWSQWLEEEPTALYGWYKNQGTPNQQQYWGNQYGNVRQNYMGQLANQALGGEMPTLQWSDYLKNYPWLQEWYKQSPYERGERQGVFNPRRRWMVY